MTGEILAENTPKTVSSGRPASAGMGYERLGSRLLKNPILRQLAADGCVCLCDPLVWEAFAAPNLRRLSKRATWARYRKPSRGKFHCFSLLYSKTMILAPRWNHNSSLSEPFRSLSTSLSLVMSGLSKEYKLNLCGLNTQVL